MKTNLILLISLFTFLLSSNATFAQKKKMSKQDKKTLKSLMGLWKTSELYKGRKPVAIERYMGESLMEFSVLKKKDKKTKKKIKKNQFRIEMGGNDRKFNFQVQNDSIKFNGVNGWNDYKVHEISKDKLVLHQDVQGAIFKWVMLPKKEEKKKKKKKKK